MDKIFACCYPKSSNNCKVIIEDDYKDFFITTDIKVKDTGLNSSHAKEETNITSKSKASRKASLLMNKTEHSSRAKDQIICKESPSPKKENSNSKGELKNTNVVNNLKANTRRFNTKDHFDTVSGSANNKDKSESGVIVNSKLHGIEETPNSINDLVVQENPLIDLEEIEGNLLCGRKIRINASGSETGLRHRKDGYTFFGYAPKKALYDEIDEILNYPDSKTEDKIFSIYFNVTFKRYYLMSSVNENSKNILFVKLQNPFELKYKNIISLGDIHILLQIEENTKNLFIEIVANKGEEIITKNFNKNFKGPIKIGRSKSNEIVLNNTTLSRTQASISFNSTNNSWILQDGIGSKPSMNGTWIFLDFEWGFVEDCIYFRIGKNYLSLKKISSC